MNFDRRVGAPDAPANYLSDPLKRMWFSSLNRSHMPTSVMPCLRHQIPSTSRQYRHSLFSNLQSAPGELPTCRRPACPTELNALAFRFKFKFTQSSSIIREQVAAILEM